MRACHAGAAAASLVALLLVPAAAAAARQPQPEPPPGRVVVIVTTLEGTVRLAAVEVELRLPQGDFVIARTLTDAAGEVAFPDVPPGLYVVRASRQGFLPRDSAPFTVRSGETAQVLVDAPMAFVLPEVQVRAEAPSPTDSVQPVSTSDMLSGTLFDTAPIAGDDFQSLLPLLPGVVRDADGRLRIKGGTPAQGALQVSSASLNDPSTGDFDLDLPAQSVQSVEVLANPFAAEYGRFSTSITQVRTRRGTNDWEFEPGNFVPRFRGFFKGVRAFEPRLSLRGPLVRDRVFLAQEMQFRYVTTPVRSLPDEPEIDLRSFDSFTRVDSVVTSRHTLGGGVIVFPRSIRRVTMNTFRPIETTPSFNQSGFSAGLVERFAVRQDLVLESTLAIRRFEIDVTTGNPAAMVYTPATQAGGFFNIQDRDVTSVQWVEALSLSRSWRGDHVIKIGADLQRSHYNGTSVSRPVEIRRADGTLAERIRFGPISNQLVNGTELAIFAQDRWRMGSRVTFELGLRVDRDGVVERINWSPRAGVAIGVLPEGRGIVRGGVGKFVQRTPLNVDAFPSYEPRTVTRFAPGGGVLFGPVTLVNRVEGRVRTPEATVANVEWDQRFGRRVLLKVAWLGRVGSHEHILEPDREAGELRLSSTGRSRYREVEVTARYLASERRDLTLSYVWSRGRSDLNVYDQFYGNLRTPIVRPNEYGPIATDVPHRLLLRGTIGLPGEWDFAPVLEMRTGFPWSAVDEYQDFVGPRNRAGRLPNVYTLDFTLTRPWRFRQWRFRAGVKMYNAFGASAARDIQANVASPFFGTPYNPIERSFGIVLGADR
jgi:hypothetical protein